MKALSVSVAVGLAAACLFAISHKSLEHRRIFKLEETSCHGDCPAFIVRIDESGAVYFIGKDRKTRARSGAHQISRREVEALSNRLTALHPFEIPSDLTKNMCMRAVGLSYVTVQIAIGQSETTISRADCIPMSEEDIEKLCGRRNKYIENPPSIDQCLKNNRDIALVNQIADDIYNVARIEKWLNANP